MSGSQAAAGLFASSFPELHKLGCWSKEKSVVKKNKQQTRFNEQQKKELERFIGSSANKEETSKKHKFLKDIYGQQFQRSCREKYNSCIKSGEFVFGQDIDDMILFLHFSGFDFKTIAARIGCKSAKVVQNRITKLLSMKRISQNPNILLIKIRADSFKRNFAAVPLLPSPRINPCQTK